MAEFCGGEISGADIRLSGADDPGASRRQTDQLTKESSNDDSSPIASDVTHFNAGGNCLPV